ncbi:MULTISPECIES: hypothetical protein [Pseudidiomarina]|uniref:Lipoprotein n=3 Tax=Pseudidiomarina TaxID=2800384 RepID=A0A368UK82_9GAMM|nr:MULTISPECIES: hypothetical protein [Pseudidiomarina]MDT7526966.1 hypothetical protein [Pseudidiomarina sp. GXY010]PWW07915.1 hypothetical protein DET45_12420 [Pseudidiomarina maritima]RBP86921.1 hypothetical protein DFO81_12420 [Pseudidiomarina tainanensis]RCW29083.1 hypothetical protein DFO79_12320 [Pseudidiomarina tainanensis]
MRNTIYILFASIIMTGCAEPEPEGSFNAVVTFPVNNICHDYVLGLEGERSLFDMSYKPFTVKLDAFPQISGFMELRSNNMINVELQNEAIKMMDKCFARAKTTVDVTASGAWIDVGKVLQSNAANGVPVHSLVLNGSKLDIYYNWDDKRKN